MNAFHRVVLAGVVSVCVLVCGLALADTRASAALQYPLVGEISPAGTPTGEFKSPQGTAVDGTSGSVIVVGESIDAFGLSGQLEWSLQGGAEGVAVNEGTGEIYTDTQVGGGETITGVVNVFSSTGTYLFEVNGLGAGKPVPKGLVQPEALAVDQATGELYVYDKNNEAIDVFTDTGEYLFQITSAGGNGLGHYVHGLAVDDSTGALLVGEEFQNGEDSVVYMFDAATGVYVTTWNGAGTPQKSFSGEMEITADNTTGDVYIAADGLDEIGVKKVPAVIDRFTATGEYESQITGPPGEPFPIESLHGVAVSPASGDVYVAQKCEDVGFCRKFNHGVVYVFAANPVAVPHVSLAPPSNPRLTSVTLHGLVDPEGTGEASCEFEYGTSTAYGQRVSCAALVANSNAAEPVEAQLTGLKSDTTYYYRLDGKNLTDGATNIGEVSEDAGQLTTPGPKLVGEGVSAVTAESASFEATVEPNGAPSSAYFQYGTSEAYGANIPASPGVPLGAGVGEEEFSRHIQGLQAGTIYHYRLVVLSELESGVVEEVDGPDRTFTTQPTAAGFALPDGRVWEMVTPAEKEGAQFSAQNRSDSGGADPLIGEASADGDAMIDIASAPTEAEPSGNDSEVSVLSTRGQDGWSSQVIAPPHSHATGPPLGLGGEDEFFSEDLSHAVVDPFGPFTALSPDASEPTLYLRSDYLGGNVNEHCESSCYRPLVTAANTRSGVKFGGETEPGAGCPYICGPAFVDATPAASFVALSSQEQLTSMSNERNGSSGPFYYEWGSGSGRLQPLYLLPESEGGRGVVAEGAGNVLNPERPSSVAHQLADNGSVFFAYKKHLYLHDFANDESVRLDIAQGVAEPAVGGASFLYASSDGSRVLFSDPAQLTSVAGGGTYECRIVEAADASPACELKLTSISGGTLIGGSNDASYLYFEDAARHLVVDHYSGGEWVVTGGPYVGTWPESPTQLAGFGGNLPVSRVSSDGRWLTFMSEEELTGYDNHDALNGLPDVEVYLYDAALNKLVCASCDPTGARPVGAEYKKIELVAGSLGGNGLGGGPQRVAANLPPWTMSEARVSIYQPRFLSDSGRLFFDSRDALVPQDVNGAQDVYEYEPPGVGDCSTASAGFSERAGGCLGLISSGASAEESAFMDASGSGGDAFFITSAKLSSQDFDNALDVYDAHECTAQTPCATPPATALPACTTGDSCKAAPTPQPSIFGAPSSATFSGAGNVSPPGPSSVQKSTKRKPLTRSQKLTRALKLCAKKGRAKRAGCVRNAHKRYGKTANRRKKG